MPLASASGYAHLLHGPLVRLGLVELGDAERPFPGRALRVSDRVAAYLLGDDTPDAELAPVIGTVPDVPWGDPSPLARALGAGATLAYLCEPATGSGRVLAVEALRLTGHRPLVIDLDRLVRQPDAARLARLAAREARLSGCGIVAGLGVGAEGAPRPLRAPGGRAAAAAARRRRLLGLGLVAPAAAAGPGGVEHPRGAQRGVAVRPGRDGGRAGHVRRDGPVPDAPRRRRTGRRGRAGAGAGRARRADHRRPPAGGRPVRQRVGARAAGAPDRAGGVVGRPGPSAGGADVAAGGGAPGAAPRAGAGRLADAARRRPRHRASRRSSPATPAPARPCRQR